MRPRAVGKPRIEDFHLEDLQHQFTSPPPLGQTSPGKNLERRVHKAPATTFRYQHLADKHLKSALIALDALTIVNSQRIIPYSSFCHQMATPFHSLTWKPPQLSSVNY